ncbi:nucleotide exchange factor GrpE [Streptantibioticus ferralitis]|uniref:Protein GrpE n=1 Tax=Streptantibioticus ferralitis TaxID=236510 RepID=A0ABT5YZJ3_9ACTN|nr:nucleotide exchange factor GrpE [Streptantibioticus ferralitis]MDF2256726.1 nucleotide exchange factor GrpE [Streptantibioticus ferralitis]
MSQHEDQHRPDEPAVEPPTGQDEGSAATPTVEELDDRWRRAMAELDNQRKRHIRELDQVREAERGRLAAAWLPVVDNLELALSHAEADPSSVVQGVRAVRDLAVQILRDLGYPRHDETDVPFDPARHEVVTVVDEPGTAPGTVVRVLRPGYGDPDRQQLRPAAVAVSRKQE